MKHLENLPNGVQFDLQNVANKVFETIATAKVSTSGEEARENNFFDFADGISVNGDHCFMMQNKPFLRCMNKGISKSTQKSSGGWGNRVCYITSWCRSHVLIRVYF